MSFVNTRWLPVAGYEGLYEVSEDGRVRSLDRLISDSNQYMNSYTTRLAGKELKPMVWRNNRLVVSLSKHGKVSRYLVYRLVAGAFCEQPVGYDVVMHLDNDPTNNHYTNLRWGTHQQNTQQAVDDGLMPRGAEVHNSKLDEEKVLSIRRLRKSGAKLRELAESFSVSEASCSNICNHKVWRHVA